MNTPWKDLNSFAHQTMQREFVTQALIQDWIEEIGELTLRQLYSYALDANTADKTKILLALQQDANTQKRYMEILRHLNAYEMVNAAAASDHDQVAEGSSPHWHYRLEAASAPMDESYLIIEIAADAPSPSRLFAKSPQYGTRDIELEKAHRGCIQMVFQNSDPLVKILNDADREVLLW